jgi:hypothetical protein
MDRRADIIGGTIRTFLIQAPCHPPQQDDLSGKTSGLMLLKAPPGMA